MKKFFTIIIFTFVVFIIWIGFSLYSAISKPPVVNISPSNIANFNTDLQLNTLNRIVTDQKYICVNNNFTVKSCSNKTQI